MSQKSVNKKEISPLEHTNKSQNDRNKPRNDIDSSQNKDTSPNTNKFVTRSRGWSFWKRNDDNAKDNSEPTTNNDNNIAQTEQLVSEETRVTAKDTIRADSSNTNLSVKIDPPSSPKSQTSQQKEANETTRKRGWSFWSRQPPQEVTEVTLRKDDSTGEDILNKDTAEVQLTLENTTQNDNANVTEPQVESINKHDNIIPNVFIPYNPDAVLVKNASTNIDDSANTQEAEVELNQPPNIVVPAFEILPEKTIWSSIQQMFGQNSHPQKHLYRTNPHENFLEMSNGETRPIKVLLIGVHGFFPIKMLRSFIGPPKGTSNRFITEAEKVVLDYFNEKNIDVEISKIALEKEGEILERVDFFYEVMKTWSAEFKKADFIYFVTHSQGCPVTIILLGKLMETGIINVNETSFFNDIEVGIDFTPRKKIVSILGMAGINNGPPYGRDQTLLVRAYTTIAKDAMMELFELQKYDSLQSKKLIQALRTVIANNVKLTFIASINDQLVPLYSSFCIFARHPNIFRATFIDKGSMTPNFITGIMNVAGKLLDLGYDDHNLVKEISPNLIGSLTGGGHSNIYNEYQVYLLGLKFALETTDTSSDVPVKYTPYKENDLKANPYRLPWAMRGLLHETRKHLKNDEIYELYKEYQEWKPEAPVLKDIKYRLNGLKYQL
ncbi:hypothetical protein C6P44_001503 [Monosporozyma unispora]|nr:hypothetical protein C6P44_001503 [Kazachstania unispora]